MIPFPRFLSAAAFACVAWPAAAAWAAPITLPGLTNEYSFDAGGGSVAVDSAGGNNATLFNFAAGNSQWITGIDGDGVDFTNANSYIQTSAPIASDVFSVSFWVRLNVKPNSFATVMLTPESENWIGYDQGRGVGINATVYDSVQPMQGIWENYVITYDRSTGSASVYRDGALRAAGAVNLPALDVPWVFGHNQDAGNTNGSLNGALDEVQFYNRVLTASDAAQLAARPPQPGTAAHLVAAAQSYGSQPTGPYATASTSFYVDPSQTSWIAWNRFPDLRATSDAFPGQNLMGTFTPEVDDYFNLTVTNPLGQKLTVPMDQNGVLGAPTGQQAVLFGAGAAVPEVARGDNSGTPYFFDETGAFNSLFTVPGNYTFDFSFQNIGGSAGYPSVYLLVNTVPEPGTIGLTAAALLCLGAGCCRRAARERRGSRIAAAAVR